MQRRGNRRHHRIRPTPPAELLADDIAALGISKSAVAEALGISRITLHLLLSQKQGVTAAMAVRLEPVLGSSADFWLGLQVQHDLWKARQVVKTSGLRSLVDQSKRAAAE